MLIPGPPQKGQTLWTSQGPHRRYIFWNLWYSKAWQWFADQVDDDGEVISCRNALTYLNDCARGVNLVSLEGGSCRIDP